ncbi:MAG: hypothetical protein E4G96_09310, partial [Chrysiogenales bacterium]
MKYLIKQQWASLAPVDVLVAGHCAVMIPLIATRFHVDAIVALRYISIYGAIMGAACFAAPALDRARHPLLANRVVRFLRYTYPMFLLGPFFRWTHPISLLFFSMPFDELLLRADAALFGFAISR